jgi:hypothetical protein
MTASPKNPKYSVFVVSEATTYNLTPATQTIDMSDQDQQIAQSVSVDVVNTMVKGSRISELIGAGDRVFIYASTGEPETEVFRGYVWTKIPKSTLDETVMSLKCYDNLIYLQESEDALYFSKGKNTKTVLTEICKKWGITLDFNYATITHEKLALRGMLSDLITSDILDKVKKKTGKKYVIRSEKDVLRVLEAGANTRYYTISAGQNAVQIRSEQTLDELVTKVVILGKQNKNDQYPIKATIKGNTAKYGTLQKLLDIGDDSLATAKKEAQYTIDENGKPKWIYEITAPDIPWIRKGDRIEIAAQNLTGTFVVRSLDRAISSKEKTITLTCDQM